MEVSRKQLILFRGPFSVVVKWCILLWRPRIVPLCERGLFNFTIMEHDDLLDAFRYAVQMRHERKIREDFKKETSETDQYLHWDENILLSGTNPKPWRGGYAKEGGKKDLYTFSFDFSTYESETVSWEWRMNEQSKSRLDRDAEAHAQGFKYIEEGDMPLIILRKYTKKNSLGGWYTCYTEDTTGKYWKPINTSNYPEPIVLAVNGKLTLNGVIETNSTGHPLHTKYNNVLP